MSELFNNLDVIKNSLMAQLCQEQTDDMLLDMNGDSLMVTVSARLTFYVDADENGIYVSLAGDDTEYIREIAEGIEYAVSEAMEEYTADAEEEQND
jgi:uncharacterized FlaG/YvyC family protein